MPLKDFAEFLEPLTPVYRGKGYPLPPVGVKDAIPLMQTLDQADEFFLSEEEFERILLGPALEQMRDDNVPTAFIRHAFTCAIVDFTSGREAAEARYTAGPELPKAPTPESAPEASTPSNHTEEAASAPVDSGSSTKTSRPSSPRKMTSATRSSGSRSSSSGRSSKRASTPSSGSTS